MNNYGKILMWSAILVSMPRWAGAFISADVATIPLFVDTALHYANLVAGVGMGFLEVLAAAYMLEAYGRLKPKKTHNAKSYNHQWKLLSVFIGGLFLLMPFILAPYIVARMNGQTIAAALPYVSLQYAWSIAVTLSPVFIVGGVAVANGELMTAKETNQTQPKKKPTPQPKKKPEKPVVTLEGTKKLVYEVYKTQPDATQAEVAQILSEKHGIEISRQAVGKHKRQLNGQLT